MWGGGKSGARCFFVFLLSRRINDMTVAPPVPASATPPSATATAPGSTPAGISAKKTPLTQEQKSVNAQLGTGLPMAGKKSQEKIFVSLERASLMRTLIGWVGGCR